MDSKNNFVYVEGATHCKGPCMHTLCVLFCGGDLATLALCVPIVARTVHCVNLPVCLESGQFDLISPY